MPGLISTTCLELTPVFGDYAPTGWTSGARSKLAFEDSCWFGWEFAAGSFSSVAGFSNENESTDYREATHGWRLRQGKVYVTELGVRVDNTPTGTHIQALGDRFYVTRRGTQVIYGVRPVGTPESKVFSDPRFPGLPLPAPVYWVSTVPSFGTVFLDACFYIEGDKIENPVGSGFNYYAGADTDPEINTPNNGANKLAQVSGELLFEGKAASGSEQAATVNGDLPFEGSAIVTAPVFLDGELKLEGLASGLPLNTLIRGELPLQGSAKDTNGGLTFTKLWGALQFLGQTNTSSNTVSVSSFLNFQGKAADSSICAANGNLGLYGATNTSCPDNSLRIFLTLQPQRVLQQGIEILEDIYLRDAVKFSHANLITEPVYVSGTHRIFSVVAVELLDQAMLVATANTKQNSVLTDTFSIQDTRSLLGVIQIAEQLVANDSVETLYNGVVQVLATILMFDSERSSYPFEVTDYVTFSAEAIAKATYLAEQLEAIMATAVVENVLTIIVDETAELLAADSVELTANLFVELLDTADIYSLFKTNGDLAQAWVMNTEAGMPISEYDNYMFTSMTTFKGQSFGTTDSGVYELEGDTDVGNPITAQVESMMLDFGTSRMKRIRTAYMGYTSSNELVLKVMSVDDGELFEHWYKASPVGSNTAPRTGMVEVGQGLRSRYWQFELTNVDGGDFELDVLELYPLFLGRRV